MNFDETLIIYTKIPSDVWDNKRKILINKQEVVWFLCILASISINNISTQFILIRTKHSQKGLQNVGVFNYITMKLTIIKILKFYLSTETQVSKFEIIRQCDKVFIINKLISIFGSVEDPRSHINQLHSLVDILLIGIISVICGAETWKQMVDFAYSKEEFLKKFLKLENGIPSDDTINRVFSAIDSNQFESCFMEWVNSISELTKGQVIAIDGKTLCGAKSKGVKSPVHMVSAWANENNLVLGQVRVNDKSNEITAIPELLDKLMIQGNIITIDAMGTQTDIIENIIKKEADYILAVKENQK